MATQIADTEGADGSNIDLKEFLQSTKIKNVDEICALLEKRNVSIEELMDFDSGDLSNFLQTDLRLDILSRKRFMKKLNAIKPKQIASPNLIPRTKVIISMKEQQAMELMHEHYDKSSKLQKAIMNGLTNLDQQMNECIDSIDDQFKNILITLVEERKAELIGDVDSLSDSKLKLLKSECESLQKYQIELNEAKEKRAKMMSTQNGNDIKQSKMRMDVLHEAMHSENAHTHFVTAPRIEFKSLQNEKFVSSYLSSLKIHTFDIPMEPYVIMHRLGFRFCSILFFVNEEFKSKDDPRKIVQYEVSWSLAPDNDELNDVAILCETDDLDMFNDEIIIRDVTKKSKKIKRKKRKQKKPKKKKKKVKNLKKKENFNLTSYGDNGEIESISDSLSDTDSQSNDESMSDSDSSGSVNSSDSEEDEKQNDAKSKFIKIQKNKMKGVTSIQITDSSQFKWKSMMIEANDQTCQLHFVQNLKPNRSYFVRVRAQNKWGWSQYSKALHFKTPKLKKEKEIKLDLVKCRGWYSSTTYHANNLLVENTQIYASPIESDNWGNDPDWLIFRPKNKKKTYYLTRLVIKQRGTDGQCPKTISLEIGDEKLSALQKCKDQQHNLLQSQLSRKKRSKLKKSVNYKWVKCKPSKLTLIDYRQKIVKMPKTKMMKKKKKYRANFVSGGTNREQSFDINPKIMPEFDSKFNYYKLLLWDNQSQGGNGGGSCKYVFMGFKLFGVEIK